MKTKVRVYLEFLNVIIAPAKHDPPITTNRKSTGTKYEVKGLPANHSIGISFAPVIP